MMKDLKLTLHFNEKINKELFLDCLTKERLNSRTREHQVKKFINHLRIEEVSILDESIYYSNHIEITVNLRSNPNFKSKEFYFDENHF